MSEIKVKKIKKVATALDDLKNQNVEINICKGEFCGMGEMKESYTTNSIVPKVVKKVKKIVKVENTDSTESTDEETEVESEYFEDDFNGKNLSDEELFAMLESGEESSVSDNANENKSDCGDLSSGDVVNYGKQISFTKVTDLDPKLYEDFTVEKYPKSAIFFDFEVFKYFWCVTFIDVIKNKKTVIVNDRKSLMKFYVQEKGKLYIAYNNRNYDNFIYKGILLGMNPKTINDKIIYDGLKGFQISDKFKDIELYAFDEYMLNKSLKLCESFLKRSIVESSVPFDLDRPLTEDEINETLHYNEEDVLSLIEVFRKNPYTYEAHMGLIDMFNYLPFNAINKTSAQIVADILKCKKGTHDESDQWNIVLPPNLEVEKYKDVINWFLNPKNHDLKAEGEFDIMGLKHKIGYGGIHSAIPKVKIDGGNIWHIDVQSYYPSLLIYAKVYPENKTIGELAFGKEGIKIYEEIYNKRLQLKHEGKKKEQAPLKIVLNGCYGILRDKNSKAYFPRGATLISVFGQMYLVDLMEHLEKSGGHFTIIQNNTDGSIIKCESDKDVEIMNQVCDDWERRTLMNLERDEISYIVQKDVNGYLFEFANGKIEVKGSYLKNTNDLDNDLPIINECMREYITHKINVEEFITNCDELWKFMKTFKLSGNYKEVYHNGIKYTNKCYRVFASKDLKDTYLGKKKENSNTIEKFAGQSDHVFIENRDIHNAKCSDYPKLDKNWYIELVYKRLEDFGIDARPSMFELF